MNKINHEDESFDVFQRIKESLTNLSESHKKIANYILKNYENVIFMTISQLSQQCDTSEATVIRFATTLGYSGFSHMQGELQEMMKNRLTMIHRLKGASEISEKEIGDNINTLYHIMKSDIDSIDQTLRDINPEEFMKAVNLIGNAENVYVVGSRSAYGLAYFFGFALGWIRENVFVVEGLNSNYDKLSDLNEKSVVLVISFPRYPMTSVSTIKLAHSKGATTIGITDSYNSPLVQFSDIVLLAHNKMLSFADNYASLMSLLTGLLTMIGSNNKEKTTQHLKHLEDFWLENKVYYQN